MMFRYALMVPVFGLSVACDTNSGEVNFDNGMEVHAEDTGGYSMDFDSFSVNGIANIGITFNERNERCEVPNDLWFTNNAADDRSSISFWVPFDDEWSGSFDIAEYAVDGVSDGGPTSWAIDLTLVLDNVRYGAINGDVTATGGSDLTSARIVISDVAFSSEDGVTLETSGSLEAAIEVYCTVLTPDECGWTRQEWPYSSEYCLEMADPFPSSVYR